MPFSVSLKDPDPGGKINADQDPQPWFNRVITKYLPTVHRWYYKELKQSLIPVSNLSEINITKSLHDFCFPTCRLLRCGSLTAKRDIVQFVELRKFLVPGGGGGGGAPPTWSKDLLAKVRVCTGTVAF